MATRGTFLLLVWKNWLLQSRKPVLTVIEIFLPVVFAAVLLGIRQLVERTSYDQPRTWQNFQVEKLPQQLLPPFELNDTSYSPTWRLAFAPNLPIVQAIIQQTAVELRMNITGRIRKYYAPFKVYPAPPGICQGCV